MKKKHKAEIANIIRSLVLATFLICISFYLRGLYLESKTTSDNRLVENALLDEAKKNLPDYDYIVNVDTMGIVWAKPKMVKITGYTVNDIVGSIKSAETLDESYGLGLVFSRILNRMIAKGGNFESVIETKDGSNLKIYVTYKTFSYKEGEYTAGKINSYEIVSDEEAGRFYSD